jgi:HK97 family phage prohead protease
MPYPNFHAGRVRDSDDFIEDSFRTKEIAPGVTIIMGKLKNGDDKMVVQTYRFDKDKFTVAEAKKWLKDHDIKTILFEPASEEKNITTEREIRNLPSHLAEVRASKDSRTIEGYGIVFNSESRDLGGFREIIEPGAVDKVLENSDVLALMNHDISRGVLARSSMGSGSMQLIPDSKGVKYKFDSPNFDLGNELLEGIRRGDIKSSSFAFSVGDGQRWVKRDDGSYLRIITKFDQIYDMSPTYREAYADTTVAIRSLDAFKKDEIPDEPGNPDPAITGSENLPVAKRILSDEEKHLRQLNYKFKLTNK